MDNGTSSFRYRDHESALGRTVIRDGELVIDGVVVCPVCLENKGSKHCLCNPLDLVRELGLPVAKPLAGAA